MATKIAFINNKGGSAKTTTLVNIAGAICNRFPEKKVCIIEGDAQGNASASFKVSAVKLENTVYDVFMGNCSAKEAVVQAFQNIDIIPANTDMNFLEFDVMERFDKQQSRTVYEIIKTLNEKKVNVGELTFEQFSKINLVKSSPTNTYFNMLDGKLGEIDKEYDIILFDTPPELKAVTSSILALTDKAIIPFEPDIYAIDGIKNILHRIRSIQKEYNPKLEVAGILATKVQKRTKLHTDIRNSVMRYCMTNKIRYFMTEIPSSIRFATATAYSGLPATIVNPKNEFTQSYYDLLDELIEENII